MAGETDVFLKDVGTWDGEIEIRPQPGAEVQRSRGVSTSRIVGGRWLVTDFRNETSGFEGHGVYGWDATKQRYVGTWIDSMRESMVVTDGTWDAATKTMTYRGELATPRGVVRWREVTTMTAGDTQVFRSFIDLGGGSEHEMMTVTYRRRG